MTMGTLISIIFGIITIIIGIIFTIALANDGELAGAISCIVITLVVAGLLIGGAIFYLNTESGKRAIKDMDSELNGGIQSIVSVYDVNGELIKTYDGKFDVEVGNADGNPYIVFDDQNNKRHIVYYTTGTIFIDEK